MARRRGSSQASGRPPRARTGCWTCRRRSVKCDEHKPACSNCTKSRLACSYGIRLTWIEDSIARGISHGREGVSLRSRRRKSQTPSVLAGETPAGMSPCSYQDPASPSSSDQLSPEACRFVDFVNTSWDDMGIYFRDLGYVCKATPASRNSNQADEASGTPSRRKVVPPAHGPGPDPSFSLLAVSAFFSDRWSPLFGPISAAEAHLLDFYIAPVCTRATLLDEPGNNPFRFILFPMAPNSACIYHGVLAVAASKLAATGKDCQAAALFHRQHALSGLRQLLSNIDSNPLDLVCALASTIPLCWFEISDFCHPTWTDHLGATALLLDACRKHPSLPAYAQDVIRFVQQYYAYHVVISKTVFSLHGILPAAASRRPIRDEVEENAYVDSHQGFSNNLLFLIDDICELRTPSNCERPDILSIAQRVTRIDGELAALEQLVPELPPQEHDSDKPNGQDERKRLVQLTADAHQMGALLFLDETCALYWPDVVPSSRQRRGQLIDSIIEMAFEIYKLGPTYLTASFPLWPVFIAACATQRDDQRTKILALFDVLHTTFFRNIVPALKVIETVWCQVDLTADENPRIASSRQGPFRAWKTSPGLGQLPDCRTATALSQLCRMDTDTATMPTPKGESVQSSWERAMAIRGIVRLCLT